MSGTSPISIIPISVTEAASCAIEELRRSATLTEQSGRRLAHAMHGFAAHLRDVQGITDLAAVTPEAVAAYVMSPVMGRPPTPSTMHFRRSVVRLLFSGARRLGLANTDPTIDLLLPPRSTQGRRPVTDDEVALCRSIATERTGTRQPVAWALAEATARTSELPHVRASDIDLVRGRVWLHDGSKTDPRWGRLTTWGLEQISLRLQALKRLPDDDPLLVYEGRGSAESRQASSCAAVAEILRAAGLASEPDVRPGSVAAWAGKRAFAEGRSIQKVACLLGVRSLDQAARLIGWQWDQVQ